MLHLPDPGERVTIQHDGGHISWLALGEYDAFGLRLDWVWISAELQTLCPSKVSSWDTSSARQDYMDFNASVAARFWSTFMVDGEHIKYVTIV